MTVSKCEKGQSTIEFLVTFPFIILFIIFFLKLSLNFTKGYLVHYATFMAGRSFLVLDYHTSNDDTAKTRARDVFESILLSKVNASQFDANRLQFNYFSDVDGSNNTHPLFKGAFFNYKETFSILRFFGGKQVMDLKSEALLGRESTRIGCLKRICEAIKTLGGGCDRNSSLVTLSDNGC